jgi:inner membrane protein
MDFLTHTLTGLFLSRAGLNRATPLATPILLVAANAPDIDAVTLAGGPLAYLHYHRHLTHSLIFMPVMAILAVLLVRAVARKPVRWPWAFAAALLAVASHLLLDLTNLYGIRLFLPFSAQWLRLDLTSVIDLWIWVALILAAAAPFLGRLVGSEISSGTARGKHYGRGFAYFGLAFLLLYNWGRGVLHERALAVLDSRIYAGAPPLRVAALPNPANPLLWRGVVETSEFYALADVNLAGDFDPTRAVILHKPEPSPALDAARRTDTFREFLSFARFPAWRVLPSGEIENGRLVEAFDLRFGTPPAPAFVATAVATSTGRVVSTAFHFGPLRPR